MSRPKPEVQDHVANPWSKPLDSFNVHRLYVEGKAVLSDKLLKSFNRSVRPSFDVFFLHVHMDVEHASCWFEGQHACLPNWFA
jgi:hypothetical protein